MSSKESQNQQPSLDNANSARMTPPLPTTHLQLVKERTPSANNGPPSIISPLPQTVNKNDSNSRFTTSNFVESVITPSESVFAEVQKNNKKRKINETTSTSVAPVSLPSIIGSQSSQSLLKQQQSSTTATPISIATVTTDITPEPVSLEGERASSSKLSANQDNDNNDEDDEDGDSGDLKFIEEPNLSTLKSDVIASSASTSSYIETFSTRGSLLF